MKIRCGRNQEEYGYHRFDSFKSGANKDNGARDGTLGLTEEKTMLDKKQTKVPLVRDSIVGLMASFGVGLLTSLLLAMAVFLAFVRV